MEDFSKFGVSAEHLTDSKEILRRNCFKCLVGDIPIFVPHGSLETFVLLCIRSGINVSIYFQDSDLII